MLESAIRLVLTNYPVTCFVVGLLAAWISLARQPRPLAQGAISEALLSYFCLFAIGMYMMWNFVIHVFFGELAAKFIGWEDSPFQLEVGFASLGFGVVGLLAHRPSFDLRLAAILGPACFMWGAAGGHIYQMLAHKNFEPGNAGAMFWWDILCPTIGFTLLFLWRRSGRLVAAS